MFLSSLQTVRYLYGQTTSGHLLDYLICSFGLTTATRLSTLLDGAIRHDKITRFLSEKDFSSADLWHLVYPPVRQVQHDTAVLSVDDGIEEKRNTDESELICWHWDPCLGRNVQGVNFLTCLYRAQDVALPVAFQLIKKSAWATDKKTVKPKQVCPLAKNDYFRALLSQCLRNQLPFRYVLADIFFGPAENMVYLKKELVTDFIFPLKDNRKVALSQKTSWRDATCLSARCNWKRTRRWESGWRG